MRTRRKRREFSKVILLFLGCVNVAIAIIVLCISARTGDATALAYLVPAWAGTFATALGFYYWKAKAENKIKIMMDAKRKGLTNDDLDPTRDITI